MLSLNKESKRTSPLLSGSLVNKISDSLSPKSEYEKFIDSYILSPIYTVVDTANSAVGTVNNIVNDAGNTIANSVSNIGNNIPTPPSFNPIVQPINNTISAISNSATSIFEETEQVVRSENNIFYSIVESFRGNWFRIIMLVMIMFSTMFLIIANDVVKNKESDESEKDIKEKEKIQIKIRENMSNVKSYLDNNINKDNSFYVTKNSSL